MSTDKPQGSLPPLHQTARGRWGPEEKAEWHGEEGKSQDRQRVWLEEKHCLGFGTVSHSGYLAQQRLNICKSFSQKLLMTSSRKVISGGKDESE